MWETSANRGLEVENVGKPQLTGSGKRTSGLQSLCEDSSGLLQLLRGFLIGLHDPQVPEQIFRQLSHYPCFMILVRFHSIVFKISQVPMILLQALFLRAIQTNTASTVRVLQRMAWSETSTKYTRRFKGPAHLTEEDQWNLQCYESLLQSEKNF